MRKVVEKFFLVHGRNTTRIRPGHTHSLWEFFRTDGRSDGGRDMAAGLVHNKIMFCTVIILLFLFPPPPTGEGGDLPLRTFILIVLPCCYFNSCVVVFVPVLIGGRGRSQIYTRGGHAIC